MKIFVIASSFSAISAVRRPQYCSSSDSCLGNGMCNFDNGNSGFCEGTNLFISHFEIISSPKIKNKIVLRFSVYQVEALA